MAASVIFALGLAVVTPVRGDEKDGRLDIYFIDVEGGAATLVVTPAGESLLIDSGFPDNGGRDRDRILKVLRDVAGRTQIDHTAVTHWHLDHYGNHAALATEVKIANFYDRGIPEQLAEDRQFGERIANYRGASQNRSQTLKVGDTLPLKSGGTPLLVRVITASGDVLPQSGRPNPYAGEHQPLADDPSDNARSLSFLLTFGPFRFLTCGDLTWNVEAKLVIPNNPIGQVDLFMVTHHGQGDSNNPVLVKAIDPRVTVMCNGPTKGGHPKTQETLRQVKSLEAAFQLHRSTALAADQQTPAKFIANDDPTANCKGEFIKASVAPDGKSYTVKIGETGTVRSFQTRS
ncbi:MAG: ComEC/Rec2 family competence protein [Planctomycetaceae bacterium]